MKDPKQQATPQAWEDVMAGLRGERLAAYDALLFTAGGESAAAAEVLAWLESHGLVVREAGGCGGRARWRARTVAQARAWWEPSHVAAVVNGAVRPEGAPLPVPAGQLALF